MGKGFPMSELSSASPVMIRNVLELSRRFQLDPDGFSSRVKVLRSLAFLMEIGIPRNAIDRFFCSCPGVLRFGVEDRLKPLLLEFGDMGFGEDLVRKEIVREPRVLSMELGELSQCLELLKTLKCREPIKENIFIEVAFIVGFQVKIVPRYNVSCNDYPCVK
ncbi:hypothetical protein CJ030_MR7G004992 [Morella rubra]|uniref:Uncharacterized protein n=1 Tax=Morella rubra TaxID=262757 RepID=A0A6A1WSG2_9ROSI|nr:hypothetical protein CJ030_MR7G004992 [Morella rubra]